MATPESGEAIVRMIPQGEKQQHFMCVDSSKLVIMTPWAFRSDSKICVIKDSDPVLPRLVPLVILGRAQSWEESGNEKPPSPHEEVDPYCVHQFVEKAH